MAQARPAQQDGRRQEEAKREGELKRCLGSASPGVRGAAVVIRPSTLHIFSYENIILANTASVVKICYVLYVVFLCALELLCY